MGFIFAKVEDIPIDRSIKKLQSSRDFTDRYFATCYRSSRNTSPRIELESSFLFVGKSFWIQASSAIHELLGSVTSRGGDLGSRMVRRLIIDKRGMGFDGIG